ncbi:MAG TPA: hypothetical protein PLN64_05870 [Candidatus Bipolaricaulis anaerobius]|mgnify:CR=1 FL=1|nr:hypothetical protein [Candidatus Bipolaricaulis anaerobius]
MTPKLRSTVDDPTVVEVIAAGRKVGEIAPVLKRWQIIEPFDPKTYETFDDALRALVEK